MVGSTIPAVCTATTQATSSASNSSGLTPTGRPPPVCSSRRSSESGRNRLQASSRARRSSASRAERVVGPVGVGDGHRHGGADGPHRAGADGRLRGRSARRRGSRCTAVVSPGHSCLARHGAWSGVAVVVVVVGSWSTRSCRGVDVLVDAADDGGRGAWWPTGTGRRRRVVTGRPPRPRWAVVSDGHQHAEPDGAAAVAAAPIRAVTRGPGPWPGRGPGRRDRSLGVAWAVAVPWRLLSASGAASGGPDRPDRSRLRLMAHWTGPPARATPVPAVRSL